MYIKIYGPYTRKDNRLFVIIVDSTNKKKTKSYPRYLMEQHLGRLLTKDETVDHINNDVTDNRIENLQILTLADNIKKQKKLTPRKQVTFICPNCGVRVTKWDNYVKSNLKKGKTGPFCSRSCAGKFMSEKV